ncbi:hypothetical protein [Streptomyces misionensis]|uniref:hypothetical protein n=1 Tax=Streptomyces misionensis TaxID=67331 RepID=UPI00396B8559
MTGAVGMKQPAFDLLVAKYANLCGQIEQLAQVLESELVRGRLPASPAVRLRGMAGRMRAEAGDLRRRQAILHMVQRETYDVPHLTPTGTLWDLPDDVRALQAKLDGETAAGLAQRAAAGDSKALTELQKYTSQAGDPNFAKALLLGLGAKGVIELPASLAMKLRIEMNGGDPDKLSADRSRIANTMKMLSKALAVGTEPQNIAPDTVFMHQIQAEGRAEHRFPGGGSYKGYQSLSTLLGMSDGQPPFSKEFMGTVGRDMIAYDRTKVTWKNPEFVPGISYAAKPLPDLAGMLHLGWALSKNTVESRQPPQSSGDFLEGLMYAAHFSDAASQELLKGNLKYLLHDRPAKLSGTLWARQKHGTDLGLAMVSAMSGRDKESERLFAEARKVLAADIRANVKVDDGNKLKILDSAKLDELSALRYSLALIMKAHLAEIDASFAGEDMGVPDPDARDYDALLAYASLDEAAFWELANAQIARTRISLDGQFAHQRGLDAVLLDRMGVLGHLLAVRKEMLAATGNADKSKSDAESDLFKTLVGTGIGYLPIPYSSLLGKGVKEVYEEAVKYGYGKVGDWLAQQATDAVNRGGQLPTYADDEQATRALVNQMLLGVALEHMSQLSGHDEKDLKNKGFMKNPPEDWSPQDRQDFVHFCEHNNIDLGPLADRAVTKVANEHNLAIHHFADDKE